MLHQKIELHADLSPEDVAASMQEALQTPLSGFHGKAQEEGFLFDYKSKGMNAFRPEIRLKLLPDEDGCLLWADMRLPVPMLIFMIFWTVLPVLMAVCAKQYLAPVLSPVFWVIALVAFRKGVKEAKNALMDHFGAYEIID